jgi:hypothetical protein
MESFSYGFPRFTGRIFIDLTLFGLQADMRPYSTLHALYMVQIGLRYMYTIRVFFFDVPVLDWPLSA